MSVREKLRRMSEVGKVAEKDEWLHRAEKAVESIKANFEEEAERQAKKGENHAYFTLSVPYAYKGMAKRVLKDLKKDPFFADFNIKLRNTERFWGVKISW